MVHIKLNQSIFLFISGTRVHETAGEWHAKHEIFLWKFSLVGPKNGELYGITEY